MVKIFSHQDIFVLLREYIEQCEKEIEKKDQWYLDLSQILGQIYSAMAQFQDYNVQSCVVSQNDQYDQAKTYLDQKLSDDVHYCEILNPIRDPKSGLVTMSLVDDLADMYQDFQRALSLYSDSPEQALAQLICDYHTHWGSHLVNVLKVLYCLLAR